MQSKPEKIIPPKGDPVSNRKCAERFVELVRDVPEVRTVLWDTLGYTPRVWTVLDQAPGNYELRQRVYDAETEALDRVPDALVGFRLLNLAEFDGARPETLLPCDAEVLWQR